MNLKNLIFIVAALLLVVIGNWITEEGVKQVDKRLRLTPEPKEQQDYYLNDVTVTALDASGKIAHRLEAKQLSYFDLQQQAEIDNPDVTIFNQDQGRWHVVAEKGIVDQKSEAIRLTGKVKLTQQGRQQPMQLVTAALLIEPNKGRAETSQAVTLKQADKVIKAVGMTIEQNGQRVSLHSNVRGRYETLAP